MDIIIERGYAQQAHLEQLQEDVDQLQEEQDYQQQRLHQLSEATQENQQQLQDKCQRLKETQVAQQRQMELFQEGQAVLQQLVKEIQQQIRRRRTPTAQQQPTQTEPVPWPTREKSIGAIRKPKFLSPLRQMVGRANVNSQFKALEAKASTVMSKIIASYHATNSFPVAGMSWDALPATLKQQALTKLEQMVDQDIHQAEDHWMASYLMNKQCTEIRWQQQSSQSVEPEDAFVTAIMESDATEAVTEAGEAGSPSSHSPDSATAN